MPGLLKARVGGSWVPAAAGGSGGGGGGSAEVWVGPNAPTGAETIWIDTDEAAPVPSDVRWDTAWGVVAEGTMPTTTDITTGSSGAVTNILNFTSVPGRKYVISFRTRAAGIYTGSGQGYGQFQIWDNITNAVRMQDQWLALPPNTSRWDSLCSEFKFDGDGVARGYYVRAYVQDLVAGSVARFHTEAASQSNWYYIRDIGPVVGSIPAVDSPTTVWTPLPLGSGWGNYGGAYTVPQYRKVGDVVTLRGLAKSTTSGLVIGTLPVGFRPPGSMMAVVWGSWNANTYRSPLRVDLHTTGGVQLDNPWFNMSGTTNPAPTSFEHLNLDGISFSVTP